MNTLKKWSIFILGLSIVSIGLVLTIKADLGVSPWDVFHIGLTKHFDLTVGRASQLTGLVIIWLSYLLGKIKPKIGTVINMILVGFMIDWAMLIIPKPLADQLFQYLYLFSGIIIFGIGAGMYISARCGTGPRDSLMMALDYKLKFNIGLIRNGMEIIVLIVGYILGGPVGIGTLCFALGVGPIVEFSLKLMNNLNNLSPAEVEH